MKKLIFVMLFLLTISPLWALFCQYCGTSMVDDARFCPKCGKSKEVVAGNSQQPVGGTTVQPPDDINDSFLRNYEPINSLEMLIETSDYQKTATRSPGYLKEINSNFGKIDSELSTFSPRKRKIHSLYLKKFDVIEHYFDAWNRILF